MAEAKMGPIGATVRQDTIGRPGPLQAALTRKTSRPQQNW